MSIIWKALAAILFVSLLLICVMAYGFSTNISHDSIGNTLNDSEKAFYVDKYFAIKFDDEKVIKPLRFHLRILWDSTSLYSVYNVDDLKNAIPDLLDAEASADSECPQNDINIQAFENSSRQFCPVWWPDKKEVKSGYAYQWKENGSCWCLYLPGRSKIYVAKTVLGKL